MRGRVGAPHVRGMRVSGPVCAAGVEHSVRLTGRRETIRTHACPEDLVPIRAEPNVPRRPPARAIHPRNSVAIRTFGAPRPAKRGLLLAPVSCVSRFAVG
jgi:hypothetical protein